MDNQRLILWHWEALYPYDLIAKGLSSFKLPEEFPSESMHIALPHDYLVQAVESFKDSKYHFGASDMLDAAPGTFTSSIAASFLVESKAEFVIIGKAFDRNLIQETTTSISHKIKAALKENVIPFLCFGETREEFEDGKTDEIIKKQISESLASFSPEEIKRIYFIYDTPNALKSISDVTPADLQKVFETAQKQYISLWGDEVAKEIKTICALEPFKSLPRKFFENSPFKGFYFKMIDANLNFFADAAKEIAPFFGKIALTSTELSGKDCSSTNFSEAKIISDEIKVPEIKNTLITPNTPTLAPKQTVAIHKDFSIETSIQSLPSSTSNLEPN